MNNQPIECLEKQKNLQKEFIRRNIYINIQNDSKVIKHKIDLYDGHLSVKKITFS